MTRKNATRVRRHATPNRLRSDKEVSRLVGTAFQQCLKQERVSVREAAMFMRVSKSTVERWKKHGFSIPVLRSRRLSLCFVKNLTLLVTLRNGRAA